ncbi:TIMELESS-interacting protein [Euwallacea fornicatus]|uniref:TIMELESS-interacting protein n=1 Tax=Euwallacea fornicatus TaxID=995702 RepID=UPI00338E45D1
MSSDEETSVHSEHDISNIEENPNEDLDLLDVPEEVQKDETADDAQNKQVIKPKRIVRNPQPKLNSETLKGPKGIAALSSYFDRVKFRGKGHEEQDLNAVMKTYEYWCHRLFPKFPFDTCMDRLEKLGSKKEVQTHIKRIRFDMLIEDKPIIDSSDEEANVDGFIDTTQVVEPNTKFNQLVASSSVELTTEQLEIMRLNKEKALKMRREKLRMIQEKAAECRVEAANGTLEDTAVEKSYVNVVHDCLVPLDKEEVSKGSSMDNNEEITKQASLYDNLSVIESDEETDTAIRGKSNNLRKGNLQIFDSDEELEEHSNVSQGEASLSSQTLIIES